MKRHLRSFVKGAREAGNHVGADQVPTPADVMSKATRMLKRVLLLQLLWFLCFGTGGVLVLWTAYENHHLPAFCSVPASRLQVGTSSAAVCAHHSYLWPLLLIVVGIAGLLVTGYVATRLAVRYLGTGAAALLRQGRWRMGATEQNFGGQNFGGQNFGGLPPGTPGGPSDFNAGLPPGSPGSPTDPPLA